MDDLPKVSVVIAVNNDKKWLRRCLNSVAGQTLQEIEVICVDMSSEDGSLLVLREFAERDSRFRAVSSKKGSVTSRGAAKNIGALYARGRTIFFMDADVYCREVCLEKAYEKAIQTQSDVVLFDWNSGGWDKIPCTVQKSVENGVGENQINGRLAQCRNISFADCGRLYSLAYLRKKRLQWTESLQRNDTLFAMKSVMEADKITYLSEALLDKVPPEKNDFEAIWAFAALALWVMQQPDARELGKVIRSRIVTELDTILFGTVKISRRAQKIKNLLLAGISIYLKQKWFSKNIFAMREAEVKARERKMRKNLPLIVSVTSFPARIQVLPVMIESLLCQTRPADRIILWLASSQFSQREAELPPELLQMRERGLEIEWCPEDLRPHKKYFYALQKYSEAIVVTVDDDLVYRNNLLERLYNSYLCFPNAVSAVRTHRMKFDAQGKPESYDAWEMEFSEWIGKPSLQLCATTGAGTLYPPGCMYGDVFDKEAIQKYCLNADDIWVKMMQLRQGLPVVCAEEYRVLRYVEGTQEFALEKSNVKENANDVQMGNILRAYPDVAAACTAAAGERMLKNNAAARWLQRMNKDDVSLTLSESVDRLRQNRIIKAYKKMFEHEG